MHDQSEGVGGPHHRMREMPSLPNAPEGIDGHYVSGEHLQVIEARIQGGAGLSPLPPHSHPNEQLTYVLAGQIRATVGTRTIVAEKGDAILIPPDVQHSVEFVGDVEVLEVFSPPRLANPED